MKTTNPALQSADEVRTAAHLLSNSADAYNKRPKAQAANLSRGEVFARLQEEQRLRGIANQLYFEASQRTLSDAVDDQADLETTLGTASDRFATIEKFEHVMALMTDLLVLGGAIISGKASPLIAALKEVRKDVAAV